jgi:DNA-binding MarR family transcriptional regulator
MQKTFHKFLKIIDFKREYQQKSSGLNFLQLHTLEKVYKVQEIKTLDISKALEISPSTLIGVLDELEKQKLIKRERQSQDKRVVIVSVTDAGEEVVKKHFEEDEKFLVNLFKILNQDEQSKIKELLDKITENITEPDELFK